MREVLRIGGVAVAIECSDARLTKRIGDPMRRFLVPGGAEADLTVADLTVADLIGADLTVNVRALEHYEPPLGRCLFDSGSVWTLHADGDALRIECRSFLFGETPYKIAVIDRELTRAEVLVRLLEGVQPYPLEFPIDELLFNALLTRRGGIELHACGVIDNGGDGYLFIGNSGDGKTTTARLWERAGGAEIVSDDRVILRPHDGAWWMYGTPWHGEAEVCSPSRAPLRRIFTLDKAGANASAAISPAQAVARILACAFPPFHDAAGIDSVIGIAAALAAAMPVTRLSFVNDPSAVRYVRSLSADRAA